MRHSLLTCMYRSRNCCGAPAGPIKPISLTVRDSRRAEASSRLRGAAAGVPSGRSPSHRLLPVALGLALQACSSAGLVKD